MAKDSPNIMPNSAQGIEITTKEGKSIILYPVNCGAIDTGRVLSYNSATGIAQVQNGWDESGNPLIHNVWCLIKGTISEPADAAQVEIGAPIDFIRCGEKNQDGGGSDGPTGFAYRQNNDSTKVSFVSFFFRRKAFDVPTDIVAGPQISQSFIPETSKVITPVDNPNNERFVDLGFKQAVVYNVIDTVPVSVNAAGFGGPRIIALESAPIGASPTTDIRVDCEAGVTGQLFSIKVVSGKIIDEQGNEELVQVFHSPGAISFGVTCCDDDETTTPPDPPDPPDEPPTEEPPPEEEPEETENPDGTNTALFCPGAVALETENGDVKTLPRTAGGETGNCSYAFSEGPVGNITSFLVNGNESGWTARIVTGFGTTTYRKAGGPNPFGTYVRDGAPTLSVRVF